MTIVRNILSIASLILLAMATLVYAVATANACEQRDPSGLFCDDPKPEPERRYHHEHRRPEVRAWIMRRPEPPEYQSKPRDVLEERRECRMQVAIVGDEARSEEAAQLQARQHWLKAVRFEYGERFLQFEAAMDIHFQCSRSDFPVTGGKVGAVADAITHQWRCRMFAVPCTAPIKREDK